MKKAILISTLFILMTGFAFAKEWELKFGDQKVGAISFPDGWEVSQSMEFIEGWSPDKAAHMVVQIVPLKQAAKSSQNGMELPGGGSVDEIFGALDSDKQTDELLDGTADNFKDDQVEINQSTKQKRGGQKVGELKGYTFAGKRDGQPLAAGTGVFTAKDKAILFSYWCLKAKETEHRPEIGRILQSIKASLPR